MYLPESIGWALEHERVSTVKIYCGDNIKDDSTHIPSFDIYSIGHSLPLKTIIYIIV